MGGQTRFQRLVENLPLWYQPVRVHYVFLFSTARAKLARGVEQDFHFWWKIFHFGRNFFCSSGHTSTPNFIPNRGSGIFSTLVENFQLPKKKFISKSHELEHSAEVENFPLWRIFFSASRPSRLPNCIPDGRCRNFSTLVENFPPRKISKKNIIPKSHELEHSAEVEFFPLLVENFPLWRNFVFGFWTFMFAKFEPKDEKWKFFHFGGKFSTFRKLQKKNFFLQNYMNWNILQRSKIFHFWWKTF